jgi:hypothetical protein
VLISEQKLHKGNKAVFDSVNRQTRRNLNPAAEVLIWKGDRKIEKMAGNQEVMFYERASLAGMARMGLESGELLSELPDSFCRRLGVSNMHLFSWSRWPFGFWAGVVGALIATVVIVPTGFYLAGQRIHEEMERVRNDELEICSGKIKDTFDYMHDRDEKWKQALQYLLGAEPPRELESRRELAEFIEKIANEPAMALAQKTKLIEKAEELKRLP